MTQTIALKQIGSERLVIRPLTEEDIPNIYALMSNYETACRTGFRPLASTSEAEGFFRESIRNNSSFGLTLKEKPGDIFGIMLLTAKEQLIGDGAGIKTVDIGYYMREDMRGNGYMPEAVDALKVYLFGVAEVDKLIIYLEPGNDASRRVVQKCGFSFDNLRTEAGCNMATGKVEDLEYYSLSRSDYFAGQGLNGGYKVDVITPGRVLSDGCPGVPKLHEFYDGDLCGLKDEVGNVVFEPVWDKIFQWNDADVVYASRGGEYGYFTTRGEKILTDVEPLEGVEDTLMPYYNTEEQGRPELMTFTKVSGPEDGRCCYMKGCWVRLGRILRAEAKKYLPDGDVLPFGKTAFDDFQSPFTYIYAAFETTRFSDNDIVGCTENLRRMGCYDNSWNYITAIYISPAADHLKEYPTALFAPFLRYLKQTDMMRISVAVDPALPEGAVRVRQIRYFKDRWPLPEELAYRKAVVEGTCDDIVRARGVALSKIREMCRQELKSAAVRDFMADNTFPGELYRSQNWPDTVKKMRMLFSYGYRKEDAIRQVVDGLCRTIHLAQGAPDLGCADEMIRWLKAEGADINCVWEASTPLDVLLRVDEKADGLQKIIATVKELGGKTVNDICAERMDNVGALLAALYPWVKNKRNYPVKCC